MWDELFGPFSWNKQETYYIPTLSIILNTNIRFPALTVAIVLDTTSWEWPLSFDTAIQPSFGRIASLFNFLYWKHCFFNQVICSIFLLKKHPLFIFNLSLGKLKANVFFCVVLCHILNWSCWLKYFQQFHRTVVNKNF